jgi:hypothetical protein
LGHERFAATGLASLGPANLHHMLARGFGAKVVVVADHPVHFGAREVQGLSDEGHGIGGHKAPVVLDVVQQRQQTTGLSLVLRQERLEPGPVVGVGGVVHVVTCEINGRMVAFAMIIR